MRIDTQDLGMTGDIARQLGVTPQAVSNWIGRRDEIGFPAEVVRLGNGNYPVFSLRAVNTWFTRYSAERSERAHARMARARAARKPGTRRVKHEPAA